MHFRARTTFVTLAGGALLTAALTGCGSSASAPSSAHSAPPTSTSAVKLVDVTLTGTKVSPTTNTVKVDKGTSMKVTVTRDSSGEVHVHGYDLVKEAKANVPVTFTFVADQQGVFDVEAHSPDLLLFKLQVN